MSRVISSAWLILLLMFAKLKGKHFYLNTQIKTLYKTTNTCPKGTKLANLDNLRDWNAASEYVIQRLGPNEAVWIRSGLGWKGVGNEHWSLITPNYDKNCHFPPKNLNEFCIPFKRTRLSSSYNYNAKLPSLCELDQS